MNYNNIIGTIRAALDSTEPRPASYTNGASWSATDHRRRLIYDYVWQADN
jgi:hypothetical protein